MESPVAKIIMLAATIAITAAVVLATWNIVGANTPDPNGKVTDKTQINHQALSAAAGGTSTRG
ncbi:MAG: hypothetical protein OXC59_10555, partial [Acidimicrobiaceae bacterium]|nr:hypothetical protein [Acidimicrobiaceae bacterium]